MMIPRFLYEQKKMHRIPSEKLGTFFDQRHCVVKLLLTLMLNKINQRNPSKKTLPKNISSKVMISKDFKKRQKNLAPHLLIILKEKITNTWLNTTTKRYISVLPTLKTSLLTKILFDETSISQKPRKSQIKTVNLLTFYHLIQIIGLSNF